MFQGPSGVRKIWVPALNFLFIFLQFYFAIVIYGNYKEMYFSEPPRHSASIDMRQPYTLASSLEVGVHYVKYCLKC